MSALPSLALYSSLMAVLSFLAGLPSFWLASKASSILPDVLQLTAGLLLATALCIVLPEALHHLPENKINSSALGPQILLGFITLYAVEEASSMFTKSMKEYYPDVEERNFDLDNDIDNDNTSTLFSDSLSFKSSLTCKDYLFSVISNSTTLGLLLHCMTDGIILATSILSITDEETETNSSTNFFLIILAIFLHKLPASFSLTSILLNENLSIPLVLFHLVLFSIAAPIGAWLTYFLSLLIPIQKYSDANSFIMLFSTGAFLYVGFHAFISTHTRRTANESLENGNSKKRFVITLIGMIIPVLVSFLHDD